MTQCFPLDGSARRLRTAPARGYDTAAKATYREAVWDAALADNRPSAKVLLLPSSEGLEIDVALARGVRPEQIVCVDRSAAVIATSRWRRVHPEIRFHATDIGSVGKKIEATGDEVDFANLDLCGRVSIQTVEQVRAFLQTCPLASFYRLAITIAKGREDPALVALMQTMPRMRHGPVCSRMRALCRMCGLVSSDSHRVVVVAEGTYTSGRHPMSWAVFDIWRADDSQISGALGDIEECYVDVWERLSGWTPDGERTWVRGEPNDSLREAVWELISALGDIDFFALPSAWQTRIFERFYDDFPLSAEQWRELLSVGRRIKRRVS